MKAGAIVQAHAGGTVRDGEKFGIRLGVCALRSSRLRVIGFLVCDLVKPGWEPGFHGVKNQGRTALLQRLEHYHRAHLVSMKNVPGYARHEQPVEEGVQIILISYMALRGATSSQKSPVYVRTVLSFPALSWSLPSKLKI